MTERVATFLVLALSVPAVFGQEQRNINDTGVIDREILVDISRRLTRDEFTAASPLRLLPQVSESTSADRCELIFKPGTVIMETRRDSAERWRQFAKRYSLAAAVPDAISTVRMLNVPLHPWETSFVVNGAPYNVGPIPPTREEGWGKVFGDRNTPAIVAYMAGWEILVPKYVLDPLFRRLAGRNDKWRRLRWAVPVAYTWFHTINSFQNENLRRKYLRDYNRLIPPGGPGR